MRETSPVPMLTRKAVLASKAHTARKSRRSVVTLPEVHVAPPSVVRSQVAPVPLAQAVFASTAITPRIDVAPLLVCMVQVCAGAPWPRARRKRSGVSFMLVGSQCMDRIDAGGAARGQVAGDQSRDEDGGGRGGEYERVGWIDAIEQRSHQTGERERSGYAHYESGADERHALPRNLHQDLRALRAQRHADADLGGALRDAVGDDAVDADGGERQRRRGEEEQ